MNTPNNKGEIPLHIAAEMGDFDTALALSGAGSNMFATAADGSKPFDHARKRNQMAVTDFFLQFYVDKHLFHQEGGRSVHSILKNVQVQSVPMGILDTEHVLTVIRRLLDVDDGLLLTVDSKGNLPLHTACQRGASAEVIHFLAEIAPEALRTKNKSKLLPLHILVASEPPCEAVAHFLELFEAAVSVPTDRGFLPVMLAAESASPDVIFWLSQKTPPPPPSDSTVKQQNSCHIVGLHSTVSHFVDENSRSGIACATTK